MNAIAEQIERRPDYSRFIINKTQAAEDHGFEPIWMPDFLFGFQKHLVEWAIRKGRAAIFADCGLGKTAMQLVWAENVVRKTNKPVLIVTPLAVGQQTVAESEKFHVAAKRTRDGKMSDEACVFVTNYEQLHKYDPSRFGGCVCDESSAIKDFKSERKDAADGQTKTPIPGPRLLSVTKGAGAAGLRRSNMQLQR